MLNLHQASPGPDKLQLTTSTGADIDVVVSYADYELSTRYSTPGTQCLAVVAAGTNDILDTPASGFRRNCKEITARNKDASLTNDLTVLFDRNGTDYERHKVTLQPGECLEYIEGIGFFTLAAAYNRDQTRYVTSDSVHATAATWANVTGLQFEVLAGHKYGYEAWLVHQTNATTTGAQIGIGGVAMTEMMLNGYTVMTLSASVTASPVSPVMAPVAAVDTAVVVETTGPGANSVPAIHFGYFVPSASGTFSVRATSEVSVAGGLTIKKGSWARVMEFDN